jgi:endonuclease YncB( thermonuclease family)
MRTVLAILLALGFLRAGPAHTAAAGSVGGATVIDGRTLIVGGVRYRLFGIDVPDLGQTCERFGRAYPCGNVARTALMDLVAGARVTCRPVSGARAELAGKVDAQRRRIAICKATGVDLSWNMVHTGWALAQPPYGRRYYGRIQTASRNRKSGLWKGVFVPPWRWREAQAALRRAAGRRICVRGRLTGEGVECQALRGADGRLYTLGKPKVTARTGAEVCACGGVVAVSICMQGTTIAVTRMGPPGDCPKQR